MESAAAFWTCYVGLGVLLIFLAWYGNRRRRLNPVDVEVGDEPLCAACGYDVRGLPGHVCPECGADLNEAGVTTAKFRRWQRLPGFVRGVIWTGLVAAVASAAIGVAVTERLPVRRTFVMPRLFGMLPAFGYETIEVHHFAGRLASNSRWSEADVLERSVVIRPVTYVADTIELRHDTKAHVWHLVTLRGSLSGSGAPTMDAIEAFARSFPSVAAGTAESNRLATTRPSVSLAPTPQGARVLGLLAFYGGDFSDAHDYVNSDAARHLTPEELDDHLRRRYLDGVPDAWFDGSASDLLEEVGGLQARLGFSPNPRGVEKIERLPLALAASLWLIVWLVGLALVTKQRATRSDFVPNVSAPDDEARP